MCVSRVEAARAAAWKLRAYSQYWPMMMSMSVCLPASSLDIWLAGLPPYIQPLSRTWPGMVRAEAASSTRSSTMVPGATVLPMPISDPLPTRQSPRVTLWPTVLSGPMLTPC